MMRLAGRGAASAAVQPVGSDSRSAKFGFTGLLIQSTVVLEASLLGRAVPAWLLVPAALGGAALASKLTSLVNVARGFGIDEPFCSLGQGRLALPLDRAALFGYPREPSRKSGGRCTRPQPERHRIRRLAGSSINCLRLVPSGLPKLRGLDTKSWKDAVSGRIDRKPLVGTET